MSEPSDRIGLVFVGGISAFGPELLQRLLAAHPQIATGPEFPHLPDVVELRRRMYASIDRGWIDLFCSHQDVDAQLRSFLEKLIYPKACAPRCRLLSEGAPENVAVFPELAQLFPEARLIHVVSDPRETIASRLEGDRRDERRSRGVSQRWKRLEATRGEVEAALEAGFRAARAAPDRVANVSCEELTRDPERSVRHLCRFLGVDWDEAFAESLQRNRSPEHDAESRSDPTAALLDARRQTRPAPADWRALLSAAERVAISRAFRSDRNLAELGYDVSTSDLGVCPRLLGELTSRIFSGASRLERRARRARRRLRSALRRSSIGRRFM